MACDMKMVCPFYKRHIEVDDATYQACVVKYCEAKPDECAVYQVIQAVNYLKVPVDLYPTQIERVPEIIKKTPAPTSTPTASVI